MNIHIGNDFGKIYDKFIQLPLYTIFNIKENIKFINYHNCMEIIRYRPYEKLKEFIPNENDLVLDIGAQFCDYSIILDKKYKAKVIAFEPLPQNYIEAFDNIAINNSSVKLYNFGIGEDNYNIELNIDHKMISIRETKDKIIIPIKTIDSFNFSNVKLIKLDVEGYEFKALNGMINTLIKYGPKLIIETHTSVLFKLCSDFLNKLNYKLIWENNKRKGIGIFDEVKETFWCQ